MIDKQYLDIFAKIPPLPQYYDTLDLIRWLIYFREEFEFEKGKLYDSIVKELTSLKTSLKYDDHSIQKAIIELIYLLIELGWIERKLNKLKVKEKRKIIDFSSSLEITSNIALHIGNLGGLVHLQSKEL